MYHVFLPLMHAHECLLVFFMTTALSQLRCTFSKTSYEYAESLQSSYRSNKRCLPETAHVTFAGNKTWICNRNVATLLTESCVHNTHRAAWSAGLNMGQAHQPPDDWPRATLLRIFFDTVVYIFTVKTEYGGPTLNSILVDTVYWYFKNIKS